jgi:hypothetical protein
MISLETPTSKDLAEIRIQGRTLHAASVRIQNQTVVTTGKWLKIACLHDEELVEGQPVSDPAQFISGLASSGLKADVFTFADKPPCDRQLLKYSLQWENWAVVPITTFDDWFQGRLPQETRKNVRRAEKRGVQTRIVPFDDTLVQGIQAIYNETPVRQGRPFWHYGKDLATVKKENATYTDRSIFIGAFMDEELIGFIKIIVTDRTASLIQILSKVSHQDKRPMNALLAKAIECCVEKDIKFLVYGSFVYGKNYSSPLTEFKRRNGFEQLNFPRYFVPLSVKGRVAMMARLHLGLKQILPAFAVSSLLKLRGTIYNRLKVKRG